MAEKEDDKQLWSVQIKISAKNTLFEVKYKPLLHNGLVWANKKHKQAQVEAFITAIFQAQAESNNDDQGMVITVKAAAVRVKHDFSLRME